MNYFKMLFENKENKCLQEKTITFSDIPLDLIPLINHFAFNPHFREVSKDINRAIGNHGMKYLYS